MLGRRVALAIVLVLGGCDVKIQRGDLPEELPDGYAQLGKHPDYTVKRLQTNAEIDAYCRANHVSAADAYVKRTLAACVIPSRQEVVLPADGVLDPAKAKAMEQHEYGHTWGLQHGSGGRKWLDASGNPAKPLTPAQAQMLLSMAEAQRRQMLAEAMTGRPSVPVEPKGLLSLGRTATTAPTAPH